MSDLPKNVSIAWDNREPALTFATVDKQGNPNIIYATCVKKYSESKLVVADNYFSKTRKNILDGSNGAILFFTKDRKSYQIKGDIEYVTQGEIFNDMKTWLDPKFPGHAAAVLNVVEVYQGAEKLL